MASMPVPIERRDAPASAAPPSVERQAAGQPPTLTGYASVWGAPATIAGMYVETFARGAFSKTLKDGADVRALVNHDPSQVLGRTKAGTLRLEEDAKGLRAVIQPPDSEWGRPVVTAVRRGDMSGMSIAFVPEKAEWSQPRRSGELPRCTIRQAQLADVSVVTYPAYAATSVSARAGGAEGASPMTATPEYATKQRQQGALSPSAKRALELLRDAPPGAVVEQTTDAAGNVQHRVVQPAPAGTLAAARRWLAVAEMEQQTWELDRMAARVRGRKGA